ncbi:MAG: hypothetical protein KBC84_11335 [Proteobacteria bacterium]|nr:hypothetical protein [Pseudomonadota bacterium]
MSDEKEKDNNENVQQVKEAPKVDSADWSPDFFPTSAKKIFIKYGVMIVGIAALCAAVYFTSDHEEDPKKVEKKKEVKENVDSLDDDDEAPPTRAEFEK